MKPQSITSKVCALNLSLLLASACTPEETTAVTEQAISNGNADTFAPFSVKLSTGGNTCSGVLVTPRWVLTANHCVTGVAAAPFKESDGWGVDADVTVEIVPHGASDVNSANARTFMTTGDAIVRKTTAMDLGPLDSRDDAARDMALVRLATRVPIGFARPFHPPLMGEARCPDTNDFSGRISGFAGDDARDFTIEPGYVRDASPSTGAVYEKEFILPIPYTGILDWVTWPMIGTGSIVANESSYRGIDSGDSGGPLTAEFNGQRRLCGVASSVYGTIRPDFTLCGPVPCVTVGTLHAAVDAPQALDFLRANIVTTDLHGVQVYDGECSANLESDADTDGDGHLDECDNCPDNANANLANSDGDAFGDACDTCPDIPNLDNSDADGDGVGNACDPCPLDPSSGPGDAYGDADGDGICNGVDLCPNIADQDQTNTNFEFEFAFTPDDIWGDACEPVPQPRTDVLVETTLAWETNGGPVPMKVYSHRADRFRVNPRSSKHHTTGVATDVDNVETHYRFCQPGPYGSPPYCDTAADLDEANLELALASPGDEHPGMPFHRITLGSSARGATTVYGYRDTHFAFHTWNQDADAVFWVANNIVNLPGYSAQTPHSAIDGYLWVHADTPVGVMQHGANLANALVEVDAVRVTSALNVSAADAVWGGYWWLSNWPEAGQLTVGSDVMNFGITSVVGQQLLSTRASIMLGRSSIEWITPSESSHLVGSDFPIAVGVDASGHVVEHLRVDAGGLAITSNENARPVVIVSDANAQFGGLPADALAGGAPTFVYRRQTGQLQAIAADGVYVRPDATTLNRWTRVVQTTSFGTIVDATVSAKDGMLYVLDQIRTNRRLEELRLQRIDVTRGTIVEIFRNRLTGAFNDYALTTDRAGDLVLSMSLDVSRRSAGEHAVAVLAVGANGITPSSLYRGSGVLSLPAYDSSQGLVAEVIGRRTIDLVYVSDVSTPAGGWSDLAALF